MREFERIRAAIIRGGTSKGVFVLQNELPSDPDIRDQVILSLYGGDDARQIDGLGGADSLTSKFAMVRVSPREDADVEYTFGQVGVGTGTIDYNSNCGNILSGVGPYAIDEGLVPAKEPFTNIRICNTNTNRVIEAHVPVVDGRAKSTGTFQIDGVPGAGAKILLNFLDAAGAKTGALFPTGKRKEILSCGLGDVEVSVVDASAPVVFVHARSLGLTGTEQPHELSAVHLHQLEDIRSTVAEHLGFVETAQQATTRTPASPKVILVAPRIAYQSSTGATIDKEDIDFVSRAMSMQKMHKTFPVTGGLCTAVASKLKGTIVNECVKQEHNSETVLIGHPSGKMEFSVNVNDTNDHVTIERAAVARTSRRLMEGFAYTSADLFWHGSAG
ncbi:2-methylaconitate cis-trans isomerase PrpF family protein [Shouchella shacheensis]|uniref:2-methylaconitate cis-trans isomerase PrpF family protein n=1 Tax=Shouchella shacheensis TaxID=1649580 RepID=UPI000740334F|nr:PrpF domain-containing protein [Shouchella shacheensis]